MNNLKGNQPKLLPIKPISEAVEEAKYLINLERSGQITGLYTRWRGINRAFMKYARFSTVTMMAGASGSGKSAILNMFEDDFTNPELNPTFLLKYNTKNNSWDWDGEFIKEPKVHVLAFKYEMDAADEVLRTLSGRVSQSYSKLLSSEKIGRPTISEQESYNKVSDEEFLDYSHHLDKMKDRPISYIETAGNLEQLYATCIEFKKNNPSLKLVITLDHTLLSQKLSEKDDLELTSHSAHTAIRLRKAINANVIFISQLNGEIEKPIRRDNPALHYPVKTDIHCGNQIYWACDNVLIYHRPEKLDIEVYGKGKKAVISKDLVHCAWIKSRKNFGGNLWFKQEFNKGSMRQIPFEEIAFKYDPNKLI